MSNNKIQDKSPLLILSRSQKQNLEDTLKEKIRQEYEAKYREDKENQHLHEQQQAFTMEIGEEKEREILRLRENYAREIQDLQQRLEETRQQVEQKALELAAEREIAAEREAEIRKNSKTSVDSVDKGCSTTPRLSHPQTTLIERRTAAIAQQVLDFDKF